MNVFFDFSAILGLLTLAAGGLWALDACVFKKKRIEKNQKLIQAMGLEDSLDARSVTPELLEDHLKDHPEVHDTPMRMSKLADYGRSFFPVLLVVFLLRAFIVEPFRIPSGSMRPTLLEGDFILVNKYAYGLRLPLTGSKLIDWGQPKRGDVMVFRYPEDPSVDFIKRVVALPGDTVSFKEGTLFLNGEKVPSEYLATSFDVDSTGIQRKVKHYTETLNSVPHSIYLSPFQEHNYPETKVPQGHYFVMGDNRDASRDSREWGFVPEELILGKAFYIWLSLDMQKKDVRWSRFGSISDKGES